MQFEKGSCLVCLAGGGKDFTEYPAPSREGNETEICQGCGVAEAISASVDLDLNKN